MGFRFTALTYTVATMLMVTFVVGSAFPRSNLNSRNAAAVAVDSTKPVIEDTGLIDGLTWTPDSQRLVLSLNRNGISKGSNNLYQLEVASGRLVSLTKSAEEDTSPCISPDGRYVAFFRGPYSESSIWVMPISSRGARPLTHFSAPRRNAKETHRAFAWSPDSKSLIVIESTTGQPPQAFSVGLSSGSKVRLPQIEKALVSDTGLLPFVEGLTSDKSGDHLAVLSVGNGHPRVSIVNTKDPAKAIGVDPYPGTLGLPRWSLDGRYVYVSADMDLTIPRERRTPTFRGKPGTFRIDINTGRPERMSDHYGEMSPDGSKLIWEEPGRNGFKLWLETVS